MSFGQNSSVLLLSRSVAVAYVETSSPQPAPGTLALVQRKWDIFNLVQHKEDELRDLVGTIQSDDFPREVCKFFLFGLSGSAVCELTSYPLASSRRRKEQQK